MARADLSRIGPGFVVAATGLGAGDIVAASQAGARYGTVLLWAVLLGGILKFVLNEGLARWQLVTGTTLLEGWVDRLPRFVTWYFGAYLLLWSFMVSAALMAACGLAAYAIWPVFSVAQWGVIHSLLAWLLVSKGGYRLLEKLMKVFVGLMFCAIMLCAVLVLPPAGEIVKHLFIPSLPDDSLTYVLGVIGGVGGSVTVMSYGYWMRESGWQGPEKISVMRTDIGTAYLLTALFGIAVLLVSAGVGPEVISGNEMALAVSDRVEEVLGSWGKWLFLAGFWGAVFTSMVGVWDGVPYIFADYVHTRKTAEGIRKYEGSLTATRSYKGYLALMAILPMSLLFFERPVWVVMAYAITGAFFVPLLAALLLIMNGSRQWMAEHASGAFCQACLVFCIGLFGWLLIDRIIGYF